MEREERAGVLQISMPWGNPLMGAAMALFGTVWLVLPSAFTMLALAGGDPKGALPMVFALPGLGLLYRGMAGFLNTTTIAASAAGLASSSGPLPWFGEGVLVRRKDITALSVDRQVWVDQHGHERVSFALVVYLRNGNTDVLIEGFDAPGELEEVAAELRAFFEIQRALADPDPDADEPSSEP